MKLLPHEGMSRGEKRRSLKPVSGGGSGEEKMRLRSIKEGEPTGPAEGSPGLTGCWQEGQGE